MSIVKHIEKFFNKDLITGSLLFYFQSCITKDISITFEIILLCFPIIYVFSSIRHNIFTYKNIYIKLIYIFTLSFYCYCVYIICCINHLLFFADLSKI